MNTHFLKKRCARDQKAHKKVLITMNHYGKAGQTTVSSLFIPIRITKIKNTIAGIGEEVKKLEPQCIADESVK